MGFVTRVMLNVVLGNAQMDLLGNDFSINTSLDEVVPFNMYQISSD